MALTKPAGTWTYEDLLALPDDGRRWEIIDGELYELTAPNLYHATVIMNLIAQFLPVVTAIGGRIFTAPVDVFFGGANPVQPDIMVLLPDRLGLMAMRGLEGPPDILVEVLSPSNPEHDRIRKRALYARGGVREYWLVSPEAASIEVLVLDGASYRTHARAAGDEPVTSTVLPDLSFPASAVFTPIAA
jgi:Uma2 family endonuclease